MDLQGAYNIAIDLGLSDAQAKLIASQAAYETANFTSNVFKLNNNPAGIMFINKPYQKNATAGSSFPSNESKTAKYAKFLTIKDGFKDMIRITYPSLIQSTDSTTYAAKLKAQKYYTGNQEIYSAGLTRYWNLTKDFVKKKNSIIGILLIISTITFILLKKK